MHLAKIATFLNLATIKIKAEQGSIQWLTGTATTIAYQNTNASQETQCLWFGSTLWIANNDDDDSTTQKNFLDALGIKKPSDLNTLAATHGAKVLEWHNGTFVQNGLSPKQTFLHHLLGGGVVAYGGNYVPSGGVANGEYTITNKNSHPATGAIAFVKGAYDADSNGGATLHAEQKLVAALGLLRTNGTTPTGTVTINGCKPACGSCKTALANVTRRLDTLKEKSFWLSWGHAKNDRLRQQSGIGPDNNGGIRKLDVTVYFT